MVSGRTPSFAIPLLLYLGLEILPRPVMAGSVTSPAITLAKTYDRSIEVSQYWVSEKLDGVRAYWDGQWLISRQGNRFHAPAWFLRGFPDQPLDGELWIGRNSFQLLMSIIKNPGGDTSGWRRVRYCVFDLPRHAGTFTQRLSALQALISDSDNTHLRLVRQYRVRDAAALMQTLDAVIAAGGEGLMLRAADAGYLAGRSDTLLKLKRHADAEARVIAHLPGKGRHQGRLGALLVEDADGRRFRIGTGFSDAEREKPPALGSLITYKYYGRTRRGVPRFASFIRIRQPE